MNDMTPMDAAAFAVQEIRTKHAKLLVVLEAIDTLMGIDYKYAQDAEMTIQEAAQIVLEGGFGWIENPETDMHKVRRYLVEQKSKMDEDLLQSLIERDQLQTDALNKTLIWIESERDRLAALEENKETDRESSLETISDILEGRI